MNRATAWILGGAAVVAFLGLGVSGLFGQRFATEQVGGSVGRFVVVRNTDDAIIIMDSTTGDLFRASQDDVKPFANRPQTARDGWNRDKGTVIVKDIGPITADKDVKVSPKDKTFTPLPPPPTDK